MFTISAQVSHRLRIALWVLVGLEAFSSLLVLAFAGTMPSKFEDIGLASAPSKTIYNIVCAVFTMLAFLAVLPLWYFKPGFWTSFVDRFSPWLAIGAHILASIFWIASAGSAFLTCPDICAAEPNNNSVFVHWSTLCCVCPSSEKVTCGDGTGRSEGFNENIGSAVIGHIYQANQAFNVLQMLFFMATATILIVDYLGTRDPSQPSGTPLHSGWFSSRQAAADESSKEPMRYSQTEIYPEPYHGYPSQSGPQVYHGA